MRRWTSWAWGGSCDKPIADVVSVWLEASTAGLDRAQAEETPTSVSDAPLNRLADTSSDATLVTPLNFHEHTDMCCVSSLEFSLSNSGLRKP